MPVEVREYQSQPLDTAYLWLILEEFEKAEGAMSATRTRELLTRDESFKISVFYHILKVVREKRATA